MTFPVRSYGRLQNKHRFLVRYKFPNTTKYSEQNLSTHLLSSKAAYIVEVSGCVYVCVTHSTGSGTIYLLLWGILTHREMPSRAQQKPSKSCRRVVWWSQCMNPNPAWVHSPSIFGIKPNLDQLPCFIIRTYLLKPLYSLLENAGRYLPVGNDISLPRPTNSELFHKLPGHIRHMVKQLELAWQEVDKFKLTPSLIRTNTTGLSWWLIQDQVQKEFFQSAPEWTKKYLGNMQTFYSVVVAVRGQKGVSPAVGLLYLFRTQGVHDSFVIALFFCFSP